MLAPPVISELEPALIDTYRAIQVVADGALQLTERDLVQPTPGQVRVRVEACGICHTDSVSVHPHKADRPSRVAGHEAVGVIACTDQPWTGVQVDGGYAEVLYARQSGLVAIPDSLSSVDAAPLLCAGFTTYNALLKARLLPGSLVAVQAIGGLGHLGVQYAKRMGLQVVAIARGTAKRELAQRLGADHYIDSPSTDPGGALQALGGAKAVIATAATGTSIQNERNLSFAQAQGVAAMVEPATLEDSAEAFAKMMSGAARFRMVLTV